MSSGQRGGGGRAVALVLVAVLAIGGAVGVLLAAAYFTGGGAVVQSATSDTGMGCLGSGAATQAADGQWSAEQMTNAATIVQVGASRRVPSQGWIIAVATAMQESHLINLNHGDRDSLGLFQQRPSQGWGSPTQIMNPVYAATQFYAHLVKVPGWQSMPLTVAAQAVQHSGDPGAYAQWQHQATLVVSRVSGAVSLTAAGQGSCSPGQVAQDAPGALRAVLAYAYNALGTMYDFGGTCTNPHSPDMALHCDCSSLVQQSFAQAGLNLPRTAEEQWQWGKAGHGEMIPISQAQVGDVVYFPTYLGPDIIGHTGIITDPSRDIMIEAQQTGTPVKFGSYNPASLPYHTHLFTIFRFIRTGP